MLVGTVAVLGLAFLVGRSALRRQGHWPRHRPAHPLPLAVCAAAAGGIVLVLYLLA